ncbi:MAG: class I SAM-dependent methyltransferase [Firmicutes bacterium]|nr:class I SAM-dependent methyltransferase [Bacillota bacterium]
MISFYDFFMKPLEKRGIKEARKRLMRQASGAVLEIGSGTGANLKFYNFDQITDLTITDKKLSKRIQKMDLKQIKLVEADVSNLPFPDDSFNTIVHTLVFCSVTDVSKGILELKRVLKPNGKIIFIEHVLPEHTFLKRTFKFINPIWRTFASGCNLTRSYQDSLEQEGFEISGLSKFMKTVFISGIAKEK